MDEFTIKYNGFLQGVLSWQELSGLWQVIRQSRDKSWYVYAVGEIPPQQPATYEQTLTFIESMDELLRREHDHDYCGIVYVDDSTDPGLVKIYDPNNLGVVCGFSEQPPLPGWVMSLAPPVDLPAMTAPTQNRRRWWQKLWQS